MSQAYDNLFMGAARLGGLCGRLGLDWQSIAPFVGAFSDQLETYQELSLGSADPGIGLMTRGSGKGFAFRFCQHMEDRGIHQDELRRFLVRGKYFEHQSLFVKLEIGAHDITEYSYYFRTRPGLDVVAAWLSDRGVDEEGLALVQQVARALGKGNAAFLAAGVSSAPVEKVYFTQPADEATWSRLEDAAGLCGASLRRLEGFRGDLTGGTAFFALCFGASGAPRTPQVYFTSVPGSVFRMALARAGHGAELMDRLTVFGETVDRTRFDYAGFKLADPLQGKVYAMFEGLEDPAGRTVMERWFPSVTSSEE